MSISKRGQMKISFGMIFSIILIVIFIAVAFYGISKFLDYQKRLQVGQFVAFLQEDIDKMWKGTQGAVSKEYSLPSNIDSLCFVDFTKSKIGVNSALYGEFQLISSGGENNLFFYPAKTTGTEPITLNHIDAAKITLQENPYCIESIKGKVNLNIKIDVGETLVTVE